MAAAKPHGGLGRGLGDLFARTDDESGQGGTSVPLKDGSYFAELPLGQVKPNPKQPRTAFDEDDLEELAASIAEFGVLQPVVVREVGRKRYELVMGERRFRASQRAGLETIPAIVRATEDESLLRDALLENLHRADLNPLEEAAAYQQLIEDFKLSHDDVARRVGKSRSAVSNTLRLFQLPPTIQKLVADTQLSAGHARALLGTPDRAFQEGLARRAVAEQLSVRDVEEAVRARGGEPIADDAGQSGGSDKRGGASPGSTKLRPPGMLELEELLSDRLDTRVRVSMGSKRGKVTIDFATLEDLERIYRAMTSPPEPV